MQDIALPSFLEKKITKLYESSHSFIGWIAEDRIIYNRPIGFLSGDSFRVHHLKVVEIVKTYRGNKIFSPVPDLQVIKPEDQQWCNEVMVPEVIRGGLRYSAHVVPASVFAQLSISKISTFLDAQSGGTFEMRSFGDEVEAYQWLKSVQ